MCHGLAGRADRLIGKHDVGVNPKINNLIEPFQQASHDLLWVLDATIAVTPEMLSRAVETFLDGKAGSSASSEVEAPLMAKEAAMQPPSQGEVGLVHHVPFALLYQKALGSRLERAYLNTTHAKMYIAIVSCLLSVLGTTLSPAERYPDRIMRRWQIKSVLSFQHRFSALPVSYSPTRWQRSQRSGRLRALSGRG